MLPRILERVHAHNPGLSASTRQGLCDDHIDAVRRGELDLAFAVETRGQIDRLRDPSTETEIFNRVPDRRPSRRRTGWHGSGGVEPADFAGETLIDSEGGCSYREAFAAMLDSAGVRVGARLDFDNYDAIRRCAIDGIGVAIVPRFVVADAIRAGTLVELPIRVPGDFVITATWLPPPRTSPPCKPAPWPRAPPCARRSRWPPPADVARSSSRLASGTRTFVANVSAWIDASSSSRRRPAGGRARRLTARPLE